MSGLFRSEDMQFVRLTMATEAAYPTMVELGKLGKFHLEDLMAEAAEPSDMFSFYKKRAVSCFSWERRLKRCEDLMTQFEVKAPEADIPAYEVEEDDVLIGLKNFLEPIEKELDRNLDFKSSEDKTLNSLIEGGIVLRTLKAVLFSANGEVPPDGFQPNLSAKRGHEVELDTMDNDLSESLLSSGRTSEDIEHKARDEEKGHARFHNYICGAIPLVQQGPFERMLFRMSRGNAYARFFPIENDVCDPQTGENIKKAVFYVVYIGRQLQRRISKMCEYFRGNIYGIPDTPEMFDQESMKIDRAIQEKRVVLQQTELSIQSTLEKLAFEAGGHELRSPLRNWQEALRKEKLVCDALKKCHTPNNRNLITADGWIPVEDLPRLRQATIDAVRFSGAQPALVQLPNTSKSPPTYFKLNAFTSSFQGIVDTYGVPRYKEINPGLFTIITFPFLFGIMYGDVGHGCLMFMFALTVVLNESKLEVLRKKKQLGELFSMVYGGRYLILLMSAFAIYCGTIYNDCLSVPIDTFGSRWEFPDTTTNASSSNQPDIFATRNGTTYPYGVDPGWYNTKNELTFFNSMKMKISVTFGVVHMTFGIILSCFNYIYFKDYVSVFFVFIPQLCFMLSTFGYMIFLVIYKFCIDWEAEPNRQSPNLIQTMIQMFLSFGAVDSDKQLYDGQPTIQLLLVALALISVPWMLIAKPYILKYQHNKALRNNPRPIDEEHGEEEKQPEAHHGGGGHGHGGHFDFSEIFIHQCIHTIEFVLGAVSNTASYLRLWALSLAHAELANVFWNKLIMQYGVEMGSPVFLFITWGAWAGATFAVLMCMDSLECFLHALRLHWVEFQNKFFNADGYAFTPFTFVEPDEN